MSVYCARVGWLRFEQHGLIGCGAWISGQGIGIMGRGSTFFVLRERHGVGTKRNIWACGHGLDDEYGVSLQTVNVKKDLHD